MRLMKACKKCHMISVGNVCPKANCGGETSKEWQGYVVVMDWTKSEIAKKMIVKENGIYALRVR